MAEAELHEHWFIRICKESGFYDDVLEEGMKIGMEKVREEQMQEGIKDGVENTIITVLSARFGAVSARMSERIHSLRERNSALLDELIKLAATVKDLSEFERKLDKMG